MSMKTPDFINPLSPLSTPSFMPNQIVDHSIRGENFDQLLENRGIRFLHYKSMPCPNINTLDDNSHDPNCPFCSAKGFIYYNPKEIYGIFQSNHLQKQFETQGVWEIGSAVVTFPVLYPDGTEADFCQTDKLEIPDFEHRLWQLIEYAPTTGDIQRLRYPITSIDQISSISNNTLKTYILNTDYDLVNGNIHWLIKPPYSQTNQRGEVISVSYYAKPSYTVVQNLRELRITQQMVNGQKVSKRLPQEVLIKKDFLVKDADKVGE